MQTMLNIAVLALLASARVPAWTVPVDSRTTAQWMAESPGRVYVIRDGSGGARHDEWSGALACRGGFRCGRPHALETRDDVIFDATDGKAVVAYVGLLNGTVLAIDMRAGRLVQRTQTPRRFYEGFTASAGTAPRALFTARR